MKEKVGKINNICGGGLFVLILVSTITALVNAITLPWGEMNYYSDVFITSMYWALFAFGVVGLALSVVNFFIKNKFKYIETIYFSLFFIFVLVITILLKPLTYADVAVVLLEITSAFSSFIGLLFLVAFYTISRALQFLVCSKNKDGEQIEGMFERDKKGSSLIAVLSTVMFVITLIPCLLLFAMPVALVKDNVRIENTSDNYYTSSISVKNNSDYDVTNVYVRIEYIDEYENHKIEWQKIETLQSNSLGYPFRSNRMKLLISTNVYYEVKGWEGAQVGALVLLPITIASLLVSGQACLFDREHSKKKQEEE